MIARCRTCREPIRDCTAFERRGYVRVPVLSWYHTGTGHSSCGDGAAVAAPLALVEVLCPAHRRRLSPHCLFCHTSYQVNLYFHNAERCFCRIVRVAGP